jgi:NADH-quinone oxidoreductase subunit N
VLIVDLGFLRKATLKVRVTVAALLGVAGCGVAWWALQISAGSGYNLDEALILAQGGYIAAAQAGILVLTALTLLLLIDSDFTRHVGEFVAVVLMAASACSLPPRRIC